jgi:hypothetical protein
MRKRRSPIPIAAHLITKRYGYTHHGIYIGRNRVVHYSGLSRGISSGPVEVASIERFSLGRGYAIVAHLNAKFKKQEIVQRALRRVGENEYDVASNNCEHFVFWAIEDYHHSPQVVRASPFALGFSASTAGILARGVVSTVGPVAGLSGAGTMSGLAAVGGTIGAGAVGGLGILGGAGGLAAASVINNTILRDDVSLSSDERNSRSSGRKASYAGAAVGTASSIATVAAVGIPGLSAAGITSGLAAVGSSVGGGMAAGVVVTTATPVVVAVALGFGVYKLLQWRKNNRAAASPRHPTRLGVPAISG